MQRRKERYRHLNAEFQRRDKKDFFSDQCKEIEKNNRMGKTRDLFKNVRDTKGTFHVKMGTIKDRNGMDLQRQSTIALQILHALCAVAFWASAILQYLSYRK